MTGGQYGKTQCQYTVHPPTYPTASIPGTAVPYSARTQEEIAISNQRCASRVQEHAAKKWIDKEAMEQILKLRIDVELEKENLAETLFIDSDGMLKRRQEFMLDMYKEYAIAKFRIGNPVLYINGKGASVLEVPVLVHGKAPDSLILEIGKKEARYYWSKLAQKKLEVLKRRCDRADLIFDVLDVIIKSAERRILPLRRGFYSNEAGSWEYAGNDDLTWKEVIAYARL